MPIGIFPESLSVIKNPPMYRIELPYAVGAVSVLGGVILTKGTAPIFKGWIGKSFEMFKDHYKTKYNDKFKVIRLDEQDNNQD